MGTNWKEIDNLKITLTLNKGLIPISATVSPSVMGSIISNNHFLYGEVRECFTLLYISSSLVAMKATVCNLKHCQSYGFPSESNINL